MLENQGLTKARLERDQMALGVFPNCHECQQNKFSGFEKNLRLFTSWPKTRAVLEILRTSIRREQLHYAMFVI